MMKKAAISFALGMYVIISASLFVVANNSVVFAAEGQPCPLTSGRFLGLPAWYAYLEHKEDATGRCAPVLSGDDAAAKVNSALPIGLAILEGMLRISGLVAVVMIFWSAFKFITTQGAPDAAAGARKTAINAVIGLVIVIVATTLVSFVGNSLLPSPPASSQTVAP
jgi:hypothetical protein